MGTAIKHPVPDRVKPSFVIFDMHSDAQYWASECPDVKNYKWRLNPVWHRMLYSCTHMATVGFKGLSVWRVQAVVVSAYGVEGCSSVMRWTVVVVVCARRRDLTLIVWQYCWAVHRRRRHTVHQMLICTVRTTRLEPGTHLLVYRRTLPLVDVATGWLYMASPWWLRDIIMNW